MGRPATKPKALKDGYYLELRNPNAQTGIKIRRDTREEIDVAMEHYKNSKNVNYLGELKKGKWVDAKKTG